MKSLITAALLGFVTFQEVQAIHLSQPASGVSGQAETAAKNAGAKGIQEIQDNRGVIRQQIPHENVQNVHAKVVATNTDQLAYNRIKEEADTYARLQKEKPSQEELDRILHEKITAEIKARKETNEKIIDALNEKMQEEAKANDIRWRNEYMGRMNRQKRW